MTILFHSGKKGKSSEDTIFNLLARILVYYHPVFLIGIYASSFTITHFYCLLERCLMIFFKHFNQMCLNPSLHDQKFILWKQS